MATLNERIKKFYNTSTPLWLNTWGEHMHHGYYGKDGKTKKGDKEAQIDLLNELIEWADIKNPKYILDAGCGVGGSARFLAKKYHAQVLGLTLSEIQAENAKQFNIDAGLREKIKIRVQDMLTLTPKDGPFDLIWALESAEHVPHKEGLSNIFYSLLIPEGKCLVATWCINKPYDELNKSEKKLISHIENLYHIPPMICMAEYQVCFEHSGFKNIKIEEWSNAVAPFWDALIRSALKWKSITGLLRSGMTTIKGAWAMQFMKKGFKKGLIQFVVIQAQK